MLEPNPPQNSNNLHHTAQAIQQIFHNLRLEPNIRGWFQLRKRAAQRLKNISGGTIELAEGGYRGHHVRHWMRHLTCGCLFLASVQEVFDTDADLVCPFCNVSTVDDMTRFGSAAAVRELVHWMASGVDFPETNNLGRASDDYDFVCTIHDIRLTSSFTDFVANPDDLCPVCRFNKPNQ